MSKKTISIFIVLFAATFTYAQLQRRTSAREDNTVRDLRQKIQELEQLNQKQQILILKLTKRLKGYQVLFQKFRIDPVLATLTEMDLPLQDRQCFFFGEKDSILCVQILDKGTMIAELRTKDGGRQTVWLSGLDTSSYADGNYFFVSPDIFFVVRGNKTYQTALGSTKTLINVEVYK